MTNTLYNPGCPWTYHSPASATQVAEFTNLNRQVQPMSILFKNFDTLFKILLYLEFISISTIIWDIFFVWDIFNVKKYRS